MQLNSMRDKPLSISDQQRTLILAVAQAMPPPTRCAFLNTIADQLEGCRDGIDDRLVQSAIDRALERLLPAA